MIRTKSRFYPFSIFGDELNAYGEPILSAPKGFVKMAIYQTSQTAADNIKYSDCEFMGLTIDKAIDDGDTILLEPEREVVYQIYDDRDKADFNDWEVQKILPELSLFIRSFFDNVQLPSFAKNNMKR